VRVVLREIAAGKRLYEWHTPDGYNAHGDCRDRVPELRSRMAELAAWADGGRDDASPYAAILGDGTEEKRWLVASLCKHVAAQHAALPGGNPLPVPSA